MNDFKQQARQIVATIREQGLCIDDLETLLARELQIAYGNGTETGWTGIQDSDSKWIQSWEK